MLNDWISFLFIKSKVNLLLFFYSDQSSKLFNQTTEAVFVYEQQIRRYLGLGFFLSFIPQTEASIARKALFLNLKALDEQLHFREKILSRLLASPLYFILSPLYNLCGIFNDYFDINHRYKFSWNPSNYLNPIAYILHPMCLFSRFYMYLIEKSIDHQLNVFDRVLAGALFVPFCCVSFVFFIPLVLLYMTLDLILNAIALFTLEPLIFAFQVIQQLITNWNDEILFVPTAEYNSVNKIQQALNIKNNNELLASTIQVKIEENDFTFKLISPEEKNLYNKYQNSSFFKVYKNIIFTSTNTNKSIAEVYHSLENLLPFYFFTIRNYIPQDIFNKIKDELVEIGEAQLKDNNASL